MLPYQSLFATLADAKSIDTFYLKNTILNCGTMEQLAEEIVNISKLHFCADSLSDVVRVIIKRLFEENSSSGLFPQIMSFWFDSAMCLNVVAMCLDCQEWKGDTVHEL